MSVRPALLRHNIVLPPPPVYCQVALEIEDAEVSARFVKARLERTMLGQVSRSVRIVLARGHAHVEVVLDHDTIDKLQVG